MRLEGDGLSSKKEDAIIADIKRLSYREAYKKYHIGPAKVQAIKKGTLTQWKPASHAKWAEPAVVQKVLRSVREDPHFNTHERAQRLGIRTETVQRILKEARLSRLRARLQFAGYQVEAIKSLRVARQRRIVASAPGALIHQDYKTFGMVRRLGNEEGRRIGGFVVIDSLTGYAQVHLADKESASEAVKALDKFISKAPFKPCGIVLTDNGKAYSSELFTDRIKELGLQLRHTYPYHPWQNGKAESFCKTLKYQCFPVVCGLDVKSYEALQALVDAWVDHYNTKRAHTGRNNKGLPPLRMYAGWVRATGSRLEKLLEIGAIREADIKRMRAMGVRSDNRLVEWRIGSTKRTPLAFIIEKSSRFSPSRDSLPLKPAEKKPITLAD